MHLCTGVTQIPKKLSTFLHKYPLTTICEKIFSFCNCSINYQLLCSKNKLKWYVPVRRCYPSSQKIEYIFTQIPTHNYSWKNIFFDLWKNFSFIESVMVRGAYHQIFLSNFLIYRKCYSARCILSNFLSNFFSIYRNCDGARWVPSNFSLKFFDL